MKEKPIYIFIICMLMISSVSITAKTVDFNKKSGKVLDFSDSDIEAPIWNVGDSWTYKMEIEGEFEDDLDFDLTISELKYIVKEVKSNSYKVEVKIPRGKITGSASANLFDLLTIGGQLSNAKLDGTIYIDKETLGIVESLDDPMHQLHIEGKVGLAEIEADIDAFLDNTFSCLSFPMNTGESWTVNQTAVFLEIDGTATLIIQVSLEDQYLYFYVPSDDKEEINYNCVRKESKNGYDALKITGDLSSTNEIWYAEKAGNIVYVNNENIKLYTSEGDGDKYYKINKFTLELLSTTYEPPNELPDKPNKPTGPTSGREGPKYTYCVSGGDDPDGHQVKYGIDWNDDDKIDDWTNFVDSGQEACIDHSFSSGGTFNIKAKTKDEKGGVSQEWSTKLTVTMEPNNSPGKPGTPSGDSSGIVGNSYTYTTNTVTDPDGDSVKYQFDWGDGESSTKDNPSASHVWTSKGTFSVKVRSKDKYGATSSWSSSLSVFMDNTAPDLPEAPTGPESIKKGNQATFYASTTDPENHQILYQFDWGDGDQSNWVGPEPSGQQASAKHAYDSKGTFNVKVRAKDEYGEVSDWSPTTALPVARSRAVNRPVFNLFRDFMDRHPNIFPFLQRLINL